MVLASSPGHFPSPTIMAYTYVCLVGSYQIAANGSFIANILLVVTVHVYSTHCLSCLKDILLDHTSLVPRSCGRRKWPENKGTAVNCQ